MSYIINRYMTLKTQCIHVKLTNYIKNNVIKNIVF